MALATDPQLYVHVRVVMGMILGLSVTRILSGIAKFIQHPHEHQISRIHLGWAVVTLLSAVMFWWWEYRLSWIEWNFAIYFFVLVYASVFYFMCVILFPDHLGEYGSYSSYFYAKRRWFFGILALSHMLDMVDTSLKGMEYVRLVGALQASVSILLIAGCLIAMRTKSPRFHAAFLVVALGCQILLIAQQLYTL